MTAWIKFSGGSYDTAYNTGSYAATFDFGPRYTYYAHSMYWNDGAGHICHVIPNPTCTGYIWDTDDNVHFMTQGFPSTVYPPVAGFIFQSILGGPIGTVPSSFVVGRQCIPEDDPHCEVPYAGCRHLFSVSHSITAVMTSSSIIDGWVTSASYLGKLLICPGLDPNIYADVSASVTWGSGSKWRSAVTGGVTGNWYCRNGAPNTESTVGGDFTASNFLSAPDGGWTAGIGGGYPCHFQPGSVAGSGGASSACAAYPAADYTFHTMLALLTIS